MVTRVSGQGCLVPPRPILSLLADDSGLYRHLTSIALLPFRCSVVPSLHGRDAGTRSSTMRPRVAHPTDGAGTTEGVPSRPQRCPAGMCTRLPRCGALARLLMQCGHRSAPPSPVWLGQQRTDKIPSALAPCKSPAAVRLTARLPLTCALALSEHGQALAATPSRPVGPGARPYKRDPLEAIWWCPTTAPSLTPVSHSTSVFCHTVDFESPHPPSTLACTSRSSRPPR
jgi:hypothetical protein